jgi:hypothetical protein
MDRIIGTLGTVLILGVLLSIIISLPVMLLWNSCLVPAVTGVNEIGWLQAWGLSILSGFFFKTTVSK